jgi:hypothetical protein
MVLNTADYKIYTKPETEITSIENNCLTYDFEINEPVDFNYDHRLQPEFLDQYLEALHCLDLNNPANKINNEVFTSIKRRVYTDMARLGKSLKEMNFFNINKLLFITIGNSMESYGYLIQKTFPGYKTGHIKVSRTLKDNVEKTIGKDNRNDLFNQYFHQKINEIIQKYAGIEAVIIIDTFGAGETMSTILHPFIKKGLENFPNLRIFPAVLLEGGHIRPTPPYDLNIKLVHLIEEDEYLKQLDNFRKSSDENAQMPVFTFNEYYPYQLINEIVNEYKKDSDNDHLLQKRFGFKKLKIFLDTQQVEVKNKGNFIVIPSETTRLLSNINPYFTVAQKTVFIAQDKSTQKFHTRDGHGYSRQENPPMKLHRLNNHISFRDLSLHHKIKLLFHKNQELLNIVSDDVRDIVLQLNNEDMSQVQSALESYLRKKIIYHYLSEYEFSKSNT